MKKGFILIFIALSLYCNGQPPGIDDSLMSIKGSWKKGEPFVRVVHPSLPQSKYPIVYKKLDSVSLLFKAAYPVPLGAEAKWYSNLNGYPLFDKGPATYGFWSLYHSYYYNKNYKKIILGDETGTWAYVFVNYFHWLLEDAKLEVDIDNSRQKTWKLPKRLQEDWKGHPLYEAPTHSPNARAVVLAKNGRMPWKPVSQLQYLQSLKRKKQDEFNRIVQQIKTNVEYLRSIHNKEIAVIDDYIASHSAEHLAQPAVISRFKDFIFLKKFYDLSYKDAVSLVYIDESYFNKKLPSHEPQFMVLYWRWENKPGGHYFRKQFEQNFPVEQLQKMVRQ